MRRDLDEPDVTDARGAPDRAAADPAEAERLRVLERTDLLNAGRDDTFDRYVRLAASITGAEVAVVTLVSDERLRFAAEVGLGVEEADRAGSFCDRAMRHDGQLVVRDAASDPDYAPLADRHGYRLYVATPLMAGGRYRIGSLCVYDPQPKPIDDRQLDALRDLTALLSREIDTNHLAEVRADREAAGRAAAVEVEHQMRNMFSKVGAIVAMTAREEVASSEVGAITRRRVFALGQANEVAIRHDFQSAPLSEFLRAAVAPAAEANHAWPEMEGPELTLSPAAASVIVPLFDEVVHDAARRGMLTVDGGAVLSWRVDADGLVIGWTEEGEATGDEAPFTSSYLRHVAPAALRGEAVIEVSARRRSYSLRVPRSLVS